MSILTSVAVQSLMRPGILLDLRIYKGVLQGRKKDKVSGKGLLQWDRERENVLQCLTQLLQLDIRSLWSLSLVEEEFVRFIFGLFLLCFVLCFSRNHLVWFHNVCAEYIYRSL